MYQRICAGTLPTGACAIGEGFVYVCRRTSEGIRHGPLAAVDLEQYDFSPTADTLMRATEATVRERLPARIAPRREAVLEMPHVLVLTDDRENSVTALAGARAWRPAEAV